ncbi:MAG TPA: putative lipid II flippase FtsW, partial [Gaiellaceae bacterium]|nr:putative lipid II flippase FtsW [Gaiellaceae bacterium]
MRAKHHSFEWQLLVLVTLGLTAFGLVMVYSATSASAALGNANPTGYLERQAVYASIGLGLLVFAARTDFRKLKPMAGTLVLVGLCLALAVLAIGTRVNGARRWIGFGPAAFQPSEYIKLAVLVWCAAYLARKPAPRTLKQLARPIGAVVGIFALLILDEPDLGTVIALVVIVGAVLLVSGTPLPTLTAAYLFVFGLGGIAAWASPYRRARLFTFLDPWKDPLGAGLQNVQAQISIGSGGIFGRGLGNGIEKVHYLPEAHTDMIFAVIGEELGLVGAAVLVLGYCAFAYAGLRLALSCKDPFGKRLAAGITALVCGQAAINLAAVLGLAPLTGIPLPFVSYGGSSLVMTLLGVGILLNIARGHAGTQRASVPDR